eukprot:CAMPEP_0119301424 /NCGR_PEP_ID=MMETSP1333-20130426/3209_1 /TAXON_ID=418940 /ORGANISM="Scyphosphaera apsteinii, Strain RCC1455" /LENGTH=435 /DNA_ID=CAMNT_0007303495 /DNA_START=95 /DNA_END=1402 /DNA_ORIENTATION=+
MSTPGGSASTHHVCTVNSITFNVEKAYTPIELLGRGSFGAVCSAHCVGQQEIVAIKKIASVFDGRNLLEAKRTLREMQLLRHLQHENIINICYLMLSPNGHDAYIVTDKMDSDLSTIIQSKQPLSADHCQYFLYQMLCGLKYIHSANVVHRDLKPANLLVNKNCDLKISDFGLARTIDDDAPHKMTQYVVTRWYRAPEILLLVKNYTKAVDLWSVGCIFAELLRRKPIFPGHNYLHQLQLITAQLGTPAPDELSNVDQKLVDALASLPRKPSAPLARACPSAGGEALHILSKMLQFDACRRLTAEEALAEPFLESLHEEEIEVSHPEPFTRHDIEHEELDWETLLRLVEDERQTYAEAPSANEVVHRPQQSAIAVVATRSATTPESHDEGCGATESSDVSANSQTATALAYVPESVHSTAPPASKKPRVSASPDS